MYNCFGGIMNKEDFIKKLSEITKLDSEKCEKVNEIIESTFLIGKKNKEIIIEMIIDKIGIKKIEAENIYEKSMSIIKDALKDKLKHPFRSLD